MAASFAGSDGVQENGVGEPMQCWLLGDEWARPEVRADKLACHRYFVRFAFLQAVHYGGLILGFDNPDGVLCAVAILHPPGTSIAAGSAAELCMALRLICCVLGGAMPPTENKKKFGKWPAKRLEAVTTAQKSLHPLVKPLKNQYWKLEVLAVEPRFQATGVATAALEAIFRLADDDRLPMFVECAGPRLPGFYRSRGFADGEVTTTSNVKGDPGPAIDFFGLLRNPGSGFSPAAAAGQQRVHPSETS